MSRASRGGRTTDRSIVTAWVVLVASLVALVALFDWAFVHVVGRPVLSTVHTGTTGPVSGVHGTAAGSDARGAPVLRDGASKAMPSASVGEVVAESVAVSPADGTDALAAAETSRAATSGVDAPVTKTAEDATVEAVEITPVETIGGVRVEAAEVTSVEAIGGAPVGTVDDASAEAIEDEPAEGGADGAVELEALRQLLAEATAIEAATVPSEGRTEALAERTVSGDGMSRRAPATVLDDLAEAIRFEPRSATFERGATTALDELAVLLANRPDLTVTVGVAVDEFDDEARDRVLGRERGRAIIAALVVRGAAFERLSLSTDDAGASSSGSHRVRIVADTDG